MKYANLHSFDVTPREAVVIQGRLMGMVRRRVRREPPRLVAGADVAYSRSDRLVFAAVVVMTWPGMETTETVTAVREGCFPYVPGLLTFREGPAVLEAFGRLRSRPDLVFFDGQGLAHPRRLGMASHLGLFLGIPSIGCAKSRLVGEFEEPARERGGTSDLRDEREVIGMAVRTRGGVRPVFVSVGHLVDLASAVSITLEACRRRVPEPIRAAHSLVSRLKAETLGHRGAA